jgi:hypothetical protein
MRADTVQFIDHAFDPGSNDLRLIEIESAVNRSPNLAFAKLLKQFKQAESDPV